MANYQPDDFDTQIQPEERGEEAYQALQDYNRDQFKEASHDVPKTTTKYETPKYKKPTESGHDALLKQLDNLPKSNQNDKTIDIDIDGLDLC